ncbi:NAD-dependent epimerase/dehydratase family protein [Skermanella sp. TT6]|uniref:NAD-dependent epimerase/dehydratase family protein n=2 Tax=Skermanella cutis TaxID=2775420 RepID=A0ABX7BDR5_9PROT|nr:NAD-dependent epimerase/dehydratase family protein [Skermanella sp. TT6]
MRVLVTGATGFVASALIPMLACRGHHVRAAVRRPGAFPVPDTAAVGDIGPETDWSRALEGIDAVVHLAARVHQAEEPGDAAAALGLHRRVNREGTRRLAEAAAAAGVRRMVLVSTIKAVTENGAEDAVTDETPPRPSSPYGISKLEAEQALEAVAARTGLEQVVVRPPLVYGPGVGANFRQLMELCRRAPPLPFGAIRNRRSLVYVGNLAGAIAACVEHRDAPGRRFLVHDGPVLSTPDLIRAIARALGRPARLFGVPPPLLGAAFGLIGRGDAFDRLAASLELDDRAIRKTLGWEPLWSQEDALRTTAEWFNAATGP